MAKKHKRQSASKPQEPPHTSSFDSGSDSESDHDGSNPKVRSIPTQKPNIGARKSRSKSSAPDPVTQTITVARKRRAEDKEADANEAEKSKKKAEPTDDPKKTLNQRVWCDEDEIVILKGLVDYSAKKNADPFADLKDFHDFIKKDLQRKDSIKTQFTDKIRRLKTKYENNRNKEASCKEMTFQKPHEQEVYELSKSVWGNKNGVEKVVGSPKPIKRTFVAEKAVDAVLLPKRVKSIGVTVEERISTIGTEMFENGKGGAGEKEWTELRMEEMKVYLRLLEVKSAQSRFVIERLKSEGI